MSNSTNVEKSKYPKKFDIITKLDNSKKARILFLITLGISGLGVRLYFFPYDVPLFNDSQGYFWYAIDMSLHHQLPVGHSLVNNGWSSFLSFIFHLMDSNNFLDYHNMQRFVGVVFSVATIFPVYLLCSRYFKKSYSLLGATLFIFEPRLIQNSFLGTPESMYVFLMALLLFLFLSTNFKKIYLAFAIVALLALVRYEGFLMIIPLSVVFFIRFRKQKKDLIKYTICMSIFILILVPMAYLKNETAGQDGFVSHIAAAPMHYQAAIQENISTLADFLYLGSINLIKYLGWAQIPSFIIFVPLGIILIFKDIDYKKIIIILSILIMLIPAFYGYSREVQEIKYIFVLYPIFCVLACFTFKTFFERFNRKKLLFCTIIVGIIFSSVSFIEWKSVDYEHEREAFEIMMDVSNFDMKVNVDMGMYGKEFGYIHWAKIYDNNEFPNLKKSFKFSKDIMIFNEPIHMDEAKINLPTAKNAENTKVNDKMIKSIIQYFSIGKENQLTHLLIDNHNNADGIPITKIKNELKYIFSNEEEFPFLKKIYDSKEEGYNYHVKLFKINYEEFRGYLESNL